MARTSRLLAFAALMLSSSAALGNDPVHFSAGSLIIPMQGNFQTDCGAASGYGLVWRILQSNQKGHYNADHPVTVYWVINGSKQSPNRCVPSNKHTPPSPNALGPSGDPTRWDDPQWNDGCDATIVKNDQEPVLPVDYTKDWPTASGGMYAAGPIRTYDTTGRSIPEYNPVTLDDTGSAPNRFTTIQYMGGPFVINAVDAPNVIGFLRTNDSGQFTNGELTRFTTSCSCSDFNPSFGPVCNFVNMHQANNGFDAFVGKRMNRVPPKIALLDSGRGVSNGILTHYLKNAGLWIVDNDNHKSSAGCPEGTFSGCDLNGSTASTKYSGLIYDQFDANADLISTGPNKYGLLNATDSETGRLLYSVFWTPHWKADNSRNWVEYSDPGDGSSGDQRINALKNIAHFADQPGTGLMAECASLESYEGSTNVSDPFDTYWGLPVYTKDTHFQLSNTIDTNGIKGDHTKDWDARNCTDPNYDPNYDPGPEPNPLNAGMCAFYPSPGAIFSQIGDFHFKGTWGHVEQYRARASATPMSSYNPGVTRLATSWQRPGGPLDYLNAPSGNNGWDFFSYGIKDNDSKKATVLYLAGHDYSDSISGNRIVLNTLMNLGADPHFAERTLSAPVTFPDDNIDGAKEPLKKNLVLNGTYLAATGYDPGVNEFDVTKGAVWPYPYYRGNLRAHPAPSGDARSLQVGKNDLSDETVTLWDADAKMPLPKARNLFTYFGGAVQTVPTIQAGWKVQKIQFDAIGPGCVDELALGMVPDPSGGPGGTFGLIKGSDGICDLHEALQFESLDAGADFGVDEMTANKATLAAQFVNVQRFLQRLRGFCWATDSSGNPIFEPPPGSDCDNGDKASNAARFGGVVWSTPAVVSSKMDQGPQAAEGTHLRPAVAYVGGWDGQLHAIYVSGGKGYKGRDDLHFPRNDDASASFNTVWSTKFENSEEVEPGTELWSFIPPSQLPWLRTNAAKVDSSPLVADVFADFGSTGNLEWHTVLIVSIGATGREVFAMDITNPLKPVLLWDLAGTLAKTSGFPYFSPVLLADKKDPTTPTSCSPGDVSRKYDHSKATYGNPTSDPGCFASGIFDYGDMGGASSLSLSPIRIGSLNRTAVFVETNGVSNVFAGIELFAIDVASGQKLWQWERPYIQSPPADVLVRDNTTVPPPASVLEYARTSTLSDPRLYVPDMEGKIWELDARTGKSINLTAPVFDAGSTHDAPQPFATNVGVFKVPTNLVAHSIFEKYAGQRLLVAGTGGADWVPASVPGKLHVIPIDGGRPVPSEPTGFPITKAAGEHFYGPVVTSGIVTFVETVRGQVGSVMEIDPALQGATYVILADGNTDFGDPAPHPPEGPPLASLGGVGVGVIDGKAYIVSSEVSDLWVWLPPRADDPLAKVAPEPKLNPQGSAMMNLLGWIRRKLND